MTNSKKKKTQLSSTKKKQTSSNQKKNNLSKKKDEKKKTTTVIKKTKPIKEKEQKAKHVHGKNKPVVDKKVEKPEKTPEKAKIENVKQKKERKRIPIKWQNYILVMIVLLLLFLVAIGIIKKYRQYTNRYEAYSIGTKVTLNDDSQWYVINDSKTSDEYITLLKDSVLDLNKDGIYNDNDKKEFSVNGMYYYDSIDTENIGYFLNKEYKTSLNGIKNIQSIRLMTTEEYIDIRNRFAFGYDWAEENFLAGQSLGRWWLSSYKNQNILVVTERGSYILASPSDRYFIRPVITIGKENIRESISFEQMKEKVE